MTEAPGPAAGRADPLDLAAAHIDAHLFAPLTVAEIAAAAGLSPYHFSRQFSARFGESVMAHVRARRLAAAARQLASGEAPPLVELAFACGFDSQEGFTRAFTRAFGVSPGRFRRFGVFHKQETSPMPKIEAPVVQLAPAPQNKPGFRVAGVSRVFDDETKAEIPALWQELFQRLPPPARRTDAGAYGVCRSAGEEGKLHYMAALPLAPGAEAPKALEIYDVPAQTYLVFRQMTDSSDLHRQMQAAVKEIWGVRIPALGVKLAQGPDLEVYPPDFDPARGGPVEWWIPVEA